MGVHMSEDIEIPEKDFFSIEDVCLRWKVSEADIDHYVSYQETLRLCALNDLPDFDGGNRALDLSSLSEQSLDSLLLPSFDWRGKTLDEISAAFASDEETPLLSELPLVRAPTYLYQPRGALRHTSRILKSGEEFREYLVFFEDFYGAPYLLLREGEIRRGRIWGQALTVTSCYFQKYIAREERNRFENHIKIGVAQPQNHLQSSGLSQDPDAILQVRKEKRPNGKTLASERTIIRALECSRIISEHLGRGEWREKELNKEIYSHLKANYKSPDGRALPADASTIWRDLKELRSLQKALRQSQ
jgi:hypothetical protein